MHYFFFFLLRCVSYSMQLFSMQDSSGGKTTKDIQLSVKEALSSKKEVLWRDSPAEVSNSDDEEEEDEALFDARMRQRIIQKRKELGDHPSKLKQNGTMRLSTMF